jgi:hypothetical protein
MQMIRATLRAKSTADGMVELNDRVKIGATYYVDLDRVQLQRWGQTGTDLDITRCSIWADDSIDGAAAGWMPIELLAIPGVTAGYPRDETATAATATTQGL